ncbi:MAG: dienelactone hydrolase family protein [Trueperaceae bacterium]|nr:dienelactone hydrolase family protein [Trueperaceae bacterium]
MLLLLALAACSGLPAESFPEESEAGRQTPRPLGSGEATMGYYEYLPASYAPGSHRTYPLLVFFHGIGEKGDGTTDLPMVLRNGPPRLIEEGRWLAATTAPFIVVSPQSASGSPSADEVHEFISTMLATYRVDPKRVYLTGLSAGGYTTWRYLAKYQDQVAAALPIAGGGDPGLACGMTGVPVWAFHGDADTVVDVGQSAAMVDAVNACTPGPGERAKLTIYEGVGHDSWSRTYDLSGMNAGEVSAARDPYSVSIYTWLLAHAR